MNKPMYVLIIFFLLLGSMVVLVHAQDQQTFAVPPLSEKSVNLNLNRGDSVSGTLSVTGGTGTGVDFMVSDPNGKDLLSYNYTSYTSFLFSASITGTYDLIFNNSFCSCEGGKNVTLTYSINDKPTQGKLEVGSNRGFSIEIILGLVIAVLVVALVVILIFHPKKNIDNSNVSHQAMRTL